MPVMTLTFNLPEEQEEALHAEHGTQLMCILQDLDNGLRALIRYNEDDKIDRAELEKLRAEMAEACADAGISLW